MIARTNGPLPLVGRAAMTDADFFAGFWHGLDGCGHGGSKGGRQCHGKDTIYSHCDDRAVPTEVLVSGHTLMR